MIGGGAVAKFLVVMVVVDSDKVIIAFSDLVVTDG